MQVLRLCGRLPRSLGHPQGSQVGLPILPPVQAPMPRPRCKTQHRGFPRNDDAEGARLQARVLGVVRPGLLQHLKAGRAHRCSGIQLQVLIKVGLVASGHAVDKAAHRILLQDLRGVQVQVAQHAAGGQNARHLGEEGLAHRLGHLVRDLAHRHELQALVAEAAGREVQAVSMQELKGDAAGAGTPHLLLVPRNGDEVVRELHAREFATPARTLQGTQGREG
mmetsp:Transcript_40833/g.129747  ORF Transcript_40833/g.129747 Transcript_40833/m.129747 type:complete len:222 (-) Transcript_40833:580-1245(-)